MILGYCSRRGGCACACACGCALLGYTDEGDSILELTFFNRPRLMRANSWRALSRNRAWYVQLDLGGADSAANALAASRMAFVTVGSISCPTASGEESRSWIH